MTMATATQANGNHAAQSREADSSALLEQVLAMPVNARQKAVNDAIERRIEKVASVLPASLKDQAERFVRRAEITFARTAGDSYKDIYTCTPESIVRTVIEAAEVGLAIDGKLAYATPWNRNIGQKNKPKYQRECQLQIDYKGLIVVARRSGQIKDAWGRDVRDNDTFEHWFTDGQCHLHHTWDARQPRGDTYAAFAIVEFTDKTWRYEVMDTDELEAIRKRSKAKDSGPWVTDTRQMYCKTVLRRILKLYCDDPAVGMALEIDEREFSDDIHPVDVSHKTRASSLSERMAAKPHFAPQHDDAHFPVKDDTCQDSPADESEAQYVPEESEAEA